MAKYDKNGYITELEKDEKLEPKVENNSKKKNKEIIILYNSTRNETTWLPSYMKGYEDKAKPFWIYNSERKKVGDYAAIKLALGYD